MRVHLPDFIDQATVEQAVLFGLFWLGAVLVAAFVWAIRPGLAPVTVGATGLGAGAVTAGVGGWLVARRKAARRAEYRAELNKLREQDTQAAIRVIKARKRSGHGASQAGRRRK
jgi:hypothetical protein